MEYEKRLNELDKRVVQALQEMFDAVKKIPDPKFRKDAAKMAREWKNQWADLRAVEFIVEAAFDRLAAAEKAQPDIVSDDIIYEIRVLKEWGLEIPERFRHCYCHPCSSPATYIRCMHIIGEDKFKARDWLPPEQDARAFALQLKEWTGSDIELPACERHRDGEQQPQ